MRFIMGWVHMLDQPGTFTTESSSIRIFSLVIPFRHSFLGLRFIMDSAISIGAGSVGVSALPAFPTTVSTSGTVIISALLFLRSSTTRVIEALGRVTGMSRIVPSSKGGINSLPIMGNSTPAATTRAIVRPNGIHLKRSAHFRPAMYILTRNLTMGFSSSLRSLPFKKKVARAGTRVMASTAVPTIARLLVKARGQKSLPSIPLRAKTGMKDRIMITTEKNMGGPTTLEDSRTTSLMSPFTLAFGPYLLVRFLKAFSVMTIPASIRSPKAMAMPERDMMLEVMCKGYISIKEMRMARGRVRIMSSALGKWARKMPTTIRVIIASSMRVSFRVPIAL